MYENGSSSSASERTSTELPSLHRSSTAAKIAWRAMFGAYCPQTWCWHAASAQR